MRATDAGGAFRFEGLSPAPGFRLTVRRGGCLIAVVPDIAVAAGSVTGPIEVRPPGGAIRGRVLDEEGSGVPGARVMALRSAVPKGCFDGSGFDEDSVSPRTAKTTGPEGEYEIRDLPPAPYRLSAEVEGRAPSGERTVEVADAVIEGLDLAFSKEMRAAGQVVDAAGTAVEGAAVCVETERLGARRSAQTESGPGGRFEVTGFPPGRISVTAGKGTLGGEARGSLPGPDVVVRIVEAAQVRGRVEAPGASRLPEGTVEAQPIDDRLGTTSARIDGTGLFALQLAAGDYLLSVSVKGFAGPVQDLTLKAGETRDLVIPLKRSGAISGKVILDGKEEQEEEEGGLIEVLVFEDGRQRASTYARDLAFTIEDLPEGQVSLIATAGGRARARIPGIRILPGETTDITVFLSKGHGIHGYVELRKRPAAGCTVTVRKADGGFRKEMATGADGLFDLPGLAPGIYELSAEGPGPDGRLLRKRREVEVQDGKMTEEAIDLEKVSVTCVIMSHGSPLEVNAEAVARAADGEAVEQFAIYRDGGKSPATLPGGKYTLEVSIEDGEPFEVELTVPDDLTEIRKEIEVPES